jgi:hypothetical protein
MGRLSEERDVKKLHWYPYLEECPESEEGEQWEPRPPAAEFFIQILEQHCVELAQPLFQGLFGLKATTNWSVSACTSRPSNVEQRKGSFL